MLVLENAAHQTSLAFTGVLDVSREHLLFLLGPQSTLVSLEKYCPVLFQPAAAGGSPTLVFSHFYLDLNLSCFFLRS